MTDSPRTEGTAPRRVDGSMSLLVDMTTAALEPSYAEAAARKREGAPQSSAPEGQRTRGRVHVQLISMLLLLGLVTGMVMSEVRRSAQETDAVRESLVEDVRRQTRETDRLAEDAARLRSEVARVRDQALNSDDRGRAAAAQVAALELVTGGTPVEGPGVVVTLDDAATPDESSQPRGGQLGNGRIYDRDLQEVVNALWAAGAEAMSINGLRLTARTAIRSAGEAVLVDFRPLSPPYVVRAIGDVNQMETTFVDSPTARRFSTWVSLYGLGFEITRSNNLRLPAAGAPELRLARPGGTP